MNLANLLPAIEEACRVRDVLPRFAEAREPVIVGLADAAKPPVLAALARLLDGPMLVVVARPATALALIDELQAWLGDERRVLLFPERETLPYERVAPDPDALRDRLAAVHALRAGEACVVVASGLALAQRTLPSDLPPPIELRTGARTTPDALIGALLALGYRTAPLVEAPGDVARRGGIVDLFPATADRPVRVEFLGDLVESMRAFDPATQRSSVPVDPTSAGPAREVIDLAGAAASLATRVDLSSCRPAVREQFEEELARLQAGDSIAEEAFYVSFLASTSLLEHLPAGAFLVVDEADDLTKALEDHDASVAEVQQDLGGRGDLPGGLPWPHIHAGEVRALLAERPRAQLSRWAVAAGEVAATASTAATRLPFAPPSAYGGRLRNVAADLADASRAKRAVVVVSQQAQRLAEVLSEEGVACALSDMPEPAQAGAITIVHGSLAQGWRLTTSQPPLTLLTDAEVFGFVKQRRRMPRRAGFSRETFLAELQPGDFVVHIEHGIARFEGLVHRRVADAEHEYLELRYAQGDALFVPAEQVDRVSRYIGPSDQPPTLSRLGSQEWSRTKARVRRAVAELAKELLELYASRQLLEGHAFSPDGAWQQELEASFPFVETPDQLAALRDVKSDMERPRPMDRLVCGDVGYGKTEVAVRAAFKAVLDGYQVAVLVPTTVLAQQHDQTFRERLAGFPVRIEMLSRFRSDREQRQAVQALAEGAVDIVIGTHRLLQQDVSFKNLGLVVIDEEQRFGVAHKERLKKMRQEVDVLTLSATPIPRTLHMSLSGIRDMSTMETPPEDRLPIQTYVLERDDAIVREAILRELERGGQVYFVHNRVHDIELVAARLREQVPEAEIGIGHGQQPEEQLEQVMLHFVAGQIDVLVCTTIIESGLDIPNVNTIILDRADTLGLAQLYQLRGRVGRGAAHAYAYLLFDKYRSLSEPAQKRLQAIFEATELGAGFRIAQRDLEIRGAGNLLGAEQSGHIGAVGFDLYTRLLADAVDRLKAIQSGREPPVPRTQQPPITIDLPLTAHLPPSYVGDLNLRLAIYQRMAEVLGEPEVDALVDELRDRFGPLPPAAENLLFAVRIRALARQAKVGSVRHDDGVFTIQLTTPSLPSRVRTLDIPGLRIGTTQLHIDTESTSADWRRALLTVMRSLGVEDLAEAVTTAARGVR